MYFFYFTCFILDPMSSPQDDDHGKVGNTAVDHLVIQQLENKTGQL